MLKKSPVLILALLTAGCGQSPSDSEIPQSRLDALGQAVAQQTSAIDVARLSERIIARQNDYLLLDIRPQADFARGSIKSAQSASTAQLLSAQGRAELPRGRDIILYSDDAAAAAQTAALLRLAGIDAYFLSGGYRAWQRQSGNVSGQPEDAEGAQQLARQQAVNCWFEGDYVASAGLAVKADSAAPAGAGYTPPLQPVAADTLGLGLGVGLGPQTPQPQPAASDALGLGLGLGLGPEDAPANKPKPRLLIGEGC